MLFKSYAPITREEALRIARAVRLVKAVAAYADVEAPTFKHYKAYKLDQLDILQRCEAMLDIEIWKAYAKEEWMEICELAKKAGMLAPDGYCVYIVIYEDEGAKVGYAKNLAQRYQMIRRDDGAIKNMYYVPVENRSHAKAAENEIRDFIGHARKIRHIGIGDHFQCATEDIEKFFKYNKHELYEMIKNA